MTPEQAIKHYQSGDLVSLEILPNPSQRGFWFIFILDKQGKSFLLVDELDQVISHSSIDELLPIVREIGFKNASIRL